MYPDSWRPYSPWINGYAAQRRKSPFTRTGCVLPYSRPARAVYHSRFYPPDPDGNLELTVQESDGTERTRLLPYSSMPNLVHHGLFSYELAAGRYRKPFHGIDRDTDRFWQSTFSWELPRRSPCLPGCSKGSTISASRGFWR
ncbi:fimbria/pilus outer membrane usher protein [Enterobacter cloacae subsp. cloacae]|nr:fimbria/pilus outer membrane usher protein [Enterobacter cloacae subsp. cloacae]